MKKRVIAVVPAAGIGRRFGGRVSKTFVSLKGVPLIIHTLKRLNEIEEISEIIPVLRSDDMEMGKELFLRHKIDKARRIAPGGAERQDSVNNALQMIDDEVLVMVHDGARPLFSKALAMNLLLKIKGVDGVIPGLMVKETLKEVDGKGIVISTIDRERFRSIQTPQLFPSGLLKKAYKKAYSENFYATDDAALVENAGGKVRVIPGEPFNIKITTPEDLDMVEMLMKKEGKI
ncbi:MAG: 2-C-methyl-D-erythritol 4-phosphate cytidylyltransferase [Nitrospirae bacterium]|nr:2-C-methyl-D-erythritol 4-phosphate cytidylyltransferase [Nitrospirota bacterium]